MELKRHDIPFKGRKVVISEDIVTKGSTFKKMKGMIEEQGGEVVAIACVGNRFGEEIFGGIPLVSCYIPKSFELYWDEKTPENQRQGHKELPEGAKVAEKAKNEWENLVASMRK